MRRSTLSYLVFLASVICHAIAIVLFVKTSALRDWETFQAGQVFFLIMLSMVLAIVMFLMDNRLIFRLLLSLRFLSILLIGNGFLDLRDVEVVLISILILESGIAEPFPMGLISTCALSGTSLFFMLKASLAPSGGNVVPSSRVIAYGVSYFLLSWAAGIFHYYRERLIKEETRAATLDEAVVMLTEANIGFQEYAHGAEERSIIQERMRYSREIHDTIGSTLTNLMIMMEDVSDLIFDDPRQAAEISRKARDQAELGLDETRRSLYALRAAESQRLSGIRAIQKLLSVFKEATKIAVKAEYGNIRWNYTEEIDRTIYHVVQEGLTNAFRHGRATAIKLVCWDDGGQLALSIHDNGKGAAKIQEGIGFQGLQERLKPLGGRMEARNVVDGFELAVQIPLYGHE